MEKDSLVIQDIKVEEDEAKLQEEGSESHRGPKNTYYRVQTKKINWENSEDAYLHVFVDTTDIRTLEEQRANNHYQRLMLANVSHEFRTPLNAILSSLNFI